MVRAAVGVVRELRVVVGALRVGRTRVNDHGRRSWELVKQSVMCVVGNSVGVLGAGVRVP
ncbi:MAG: hypothetical protein ACT4PI_05295 [Actinomycetota bacterium]